MDRLTILSVISGALAIEGSTLLQLLGGQKKPDDEIKTTLDQLERDHLIAARKVGDESVYSITASGVAAVESAKKPGLLHMLMLT